MKSPKILTAWERLHMQESAHTARVLEAAATVGRAEAQLSKFTKDFGFLDAVSELIDAKMKLERLERGGG